MSLGHIGNVEHQLYLMLLLYSINHRASNGKPKKTLIALPETQLSNNKIPDIVVYNKTAKAVEYDKPIMVFEFASNEKTINSDIEKCKSFYFQYESLEECFVIDLQNLKYIKVLQNSFEYDNSKSDVLKVQIQNIMNYAIEELNCPFAAVL